MSDWNIEMVVFNNNRKMCLTIAADGLPAAKQRVLREFRRYSPMKRNLFLEATKNQGVYTVVSDMYDVGLAELKRMDS